MHHNVALSLPAQRRAGERGRERERQSSVECLPPKVKLQYSNLIKSIREFHVQGQPPCCAHRLVFVHYTLHHVVLHVNDGWDAVIFLSEGIYKKKKVPQLSFCDRLSSSR